MRTTVEVAVEHEEYLDPQLQYSKPGRASRVMSTPLSSHNSHYIPESSTKARFVSITQDIVETPCSDSGS